MAAYYNEIDPYAAQWLRNLIAAGHIAPGDVDERSIADVQPSDLAGYEQCHFFAGIGGWSLALRLTGWPDDRPVWTGSCPCQPFSVAGQGKAADDERHLWPAWFPLVAERRPAIIFGEQVEAAVGWGWLDAVFADLEGQGYACGASVLPACGIGAPHIRQRLWFVAHADGRDASAKGLQRSWEHGLVAQDGGPLLVAHAECGAAERRRHDLADAPGKIEGETRQRQWVRPDIGAGGIIGKLADTERSERRQGRILRSGGSEFAGSREFGSVGDPGRARLQERKRDGRVQREAMGSQSRQAAERGSHSWNCDWLPCTDGKSRPVEPSTFPLAHGVPNRVGRLRAYGNAIVPEVAAEFIAASDEAMMEIC